MRRAIPIAFFLLILAHQVQALVPQAGQDVLAVTAFPGETRSFFLIINAPASETLTTSDWLLIEGGQSFRLPSGGVAIVNLTVKVPADQAMGVYNFPIMFDTATISTVQVTVSLSPENIRVLQAQADVNQQIANLKADLESSIDTKLAQGVQGVQSQVQSIKSELGASIQEVKTYNKQVNDLETHRAQLQDQVANLSSQLSNLQNNTAHLQKQNTQLQATGNYLRSESPILFVVGLAIGAAGMYLSSRKLKRYL